MGVEENGEKEASCMRMRRGGIKMQAGDVCGCSRLFPSIWRFGGIERPEKKNKKQKRKGINKNIKQTPQFPVSLCFVWLTSAEENGARCV